MTSADWLLVGLTFVAALAGGLGAGLATVKLSERWEREQQERRAQIDVGLAEYSAGVHAWSTGQLRAMQQGEQLVAVARPALAPLGIDLPPLPDVVAAPVLHWLRALATVGSRNNVNVALTFYVEPNLPAGVSPYIRADECEFELSIDPYLPDRRPLTVRRFEADGSPVNGQLIHIPSPARITILTNIPSMEPPIPEDVWATGRPAGTTTAVLNAVVRVGVPGADRQEFDFHETLEQRPGSFDWEWQDS